ncbi:MAG: hypothetical protein ACPG7F_01730 [Aggregatilineales bacterium]
MATQSFLNEENVREIIVGIVGFVSLAVLRELRRRQGDTTVDDDIKELRRQMVTVNESYKDLTREILSVAEQRELDAAAIVLANTRKVRSLEAELERVQSRAEILEERNAKLILKALEEQNDHGND